MYPFKVILIGTGEEVEAAARELQTRSAPVTARFSSVVDALAGLTQVAAGTRLFVISLPGADDLRELRQLGTAQFGQPIVALLGADVDRNAVIEATRAGATQVVLLPLQAEEFHTVLDSVALQYGHRSGLAQLIAVCGTNGGSSSLAISVNLAYEIADQLQRDCILVEYSARFGKLAHMLRLEPRFTSRDLLLAGDRPDAHMVRVGLTPYGERLRILLAPTDEMKKAEGTVEQVLTILKLIRRLADVAVLDMPLTFDELFFRTLELADQVVILGNGTLPELQALQRACETMRQECHIRQPCPVIIRYDPKTAKMSVKEMSRVLGLGRLRTIASDPAAFETAMNNGQPLRRSSPHSPALADIHALARDLLNEEPAAPGRPAGLLRWLAQVLTGGPSTQ